MLKTVILASRSDSKDPRMRRQRAADGSEGSKAGLDAAVERDETTFDREWKRKGLQRSHHYKAPRPIHQTELRSSKVESSHISRHFHPDYLLFHVRVELSDHGHGVVTP